jgi:hypothetical protein
MENKMKLTKETLKRIIKEEIETMKDEMEDESSELELMAMEQVERYNAGLPQARDNFMDWAYENGYSEQEAEDVWYTMERLPV